MASTSSDTGLVIHSYPNNPRVFKAQIAANYNGTSVSVSEVEMGVTNKTKEFLAKNPNGKVPLLETPEGSVWESNAIARYCARLNGDKHKLMGANNYEASLVDQWIEWTRGEVDLPASAWLYPIFGLIANNEAATKAAKGDIRKSLKVLDDHLQKHQFLVADRFTMADIVVSMSLAPLYKMVLDPGFRKFVPNTNRWFELVVNQPKVKEIIGDFEWCKKMAQAPKPVEGKAASSSNAQPKKQNNKKPAQNKPAQQPQKKKDPFDDCPPCKFDFHAWKTTYTNEDYRKTALPYFWSKFEPDSMSVWFANYKYNDEQKVPFMASNLVNGFCQRVPTKVSRGAFGDFLIFQNEEAGHLEICGAFLFRGHEIPEMFKENPDFTAYDWAKVDLSDPEQKEWLEDLWGWDGKLRGKKFTDQGAIYK
eukprot:CAMPEP_0201550050 /NCGR_PEP_ID=MMETSP0173_2-20130828/6465_1 /ASSEMBLY_ACC=CAM_ASM_000268 /TAXON_ID=218659 /ORGANISM="Vexillifera sp., Strain DIVA3 564/2" /LENGTH=419 /DNA_ID=CAMNT_0047959927 /DNA_START=118 /DNA_END=1377 /DNA_ORIENTATION=-